MEATKIEALKGLNKLTSREAGCKIAKFLSSPAGAGLIGANLFQL